jgi:predicted RNA binding protein YcfA (HicA-like mRNA interferase family)
MSPKSPVFKPAELIRLLEQNDFVKVAQEGSHVKMRNKENTTLIIPLHQEKDLKRGLVIAILRQAGIDYKHYKKDEN